MAFQQGASRGLRELALFAGCGGGILGGHLLGWRTVCAVERDAYAAQVLAARQNDRAIPAFPIWSDVEHFDGTSWRGLVDVVSGGFPCQDISLAGKGSGITGSRSGLWRHMARIVGEIRPRYVFVENSPAVLTRGVGVVLSDLAALGYDCRWTVLGAADVGAPHQRDRFWLLAANADRLRELQRQGSEPDQRGRPSNSVEENADPRGPRLPEPWAKSAGAHWINRGGMPTADSWWATEPELVRMVSGHPHRLDRIKALGNAQVPFCAAEAFRMLAAQF